jgi:F-type H+-transporting ATPase subunit b
MIKLPDITLVYVIVAFAISYRILKRYLFGPLGEILDARQQEETEAARLHAESVARLKKAMADAERSLSVARREGLAIRERLRGEGRARLEERLAEATAASAESIAAASREIAQQSARLSRELPEKSRSLARELAEKILGRKLAA